MLPEQKELIQKLREARKSHKRWVSHAQILMEGIPVQNEHLPLNETECGFGQWYYGDGQALNIYKEFTVIEKVHSALHRTYLKIFHLLFNKKQSFLDRLLGHKAEPTEKELAEAKRLFHDLNDQSEKILALLNALEKKIASMSEEEFKQVYLDKLS